LKSKAFSPSNWLNVQGGKKPPPSSNGVPMKAIDDISRTKESELKSFFTPGWTGEGLLSKKSTNLINYINKTQEEIKETFNKQLNSFNKLQLEQIYFEYKNFLKEQTEINNIDTRSKVLQFNMSQFIEDLTNNNKNETVKKFLNIYTLRVAITYIFKIRFILSLSKSNNKELRVKILMNPNSFLNDCFKKGSSFEIYSEALESNIYSWYRPRNSKEPLLEKIQEDLDHVSITDLIKITSHYKLIDEKNKNNYFSHSLSHYNFGKFANTILSKFKPWISSHIPKAHPLFSVNLLSKPASDTKFSNCLIKGDYLESLFMSYWIHQDTLDFSLDHHDTLFPDFVNENFSEGKFFKIMSEFQSLYDLSKKAQTSNSDPRIIISKYYQKKNFLNKNTSYHNIQMNIFNESSSESFYDSIILNLKNTSKNNPHNNLIQKIESSLNNLKQNGLLIVLSFQKLFIPSKKSKVSQLLKSCKVEGCFNLENLEGKGELAPYIYLISKKKNTVAENNLDKHNMNDRLIKKEANKSPCLTFIVKGKLQSFQLFNLINEQLIYFLNNKKSDSSGIYQVDLSQDLTFEFYQDVIVNGVLFNSSNTDSNSITHPSFFKNLMKYCTPIDQFLSIESLSTDLSQLDTKTKVSSNVNLLGINLPEVNDFSYVLIIDFRNEKEAHLELIPIESYRGKVEEYGVALCHYFGLKPKVLNLNMNNLREYFLSSPGKQITQFFINSTTKRLKSSLKSLLVPNGLLQSNNPIPRDILSQTNILNNEHQVQGKSLAELILNFNSFSSHAIELSEKYPSDCFEKLTLLKWKLNEQKEEIKSLKIKNQINFNSKVITQELVKTKLTNLFPYNNEVFIKFITKEMRELKQVLTSTRLIESEENSFLEVNTSNGKIIEIYSDKLLLNFIDFILRSTIGYPVEIILTNTQVPSILDLSEIINKYSQSLKDYTDCELKLTKLIDQVIIKQISKN
jgi:hypothetical protein